MGLISLKRCFVRQLLDKLCELWKSCNWAAQTFHILALLPLLVSESKSVFGRPAVHHQLSADKQGIFKKIGEFWHQMKSCHHQLDGVKQDWKTLKPIGKAKRSWKFVSLFASFQTHTYDVKQINFEIWTKYKKNNISKIGQNWKICLFIHFILNPQLWCQTAGSNKHLWCSLPLCMRKY